MPDAISGWAGSWLATVRRRAGRPMAATTGEHLPGPNVGRLLAARDGRPWIGTRSGLASWKDGKLPHYPELEGQTVHVSSSASRNSARPVPTRPSPLRSRASARRQSVRKKARGPMTRSASPSRLTRRARCGRRLSALGNLGTSRRKVSLEAAPPGSPLRSRSTCRTCRSPAGRARPRCPGASVR